MPLQPTLKQVYTDTQLTEIENYITNKINGSVTVQYLTTAATATLTATNFGLSITALEENVTIANPTGDWIDMQPFMIRIKDDGNAWTITWGANFREVNTTLPTTTVPSETLYIGGVYNAIDDKFDVLGVN